MVSLIIIFFNAVDDESVLGSLPRQNTRLQCEEGGRGEKSNKTKCSPKARLESGEIHVFPVPFPLRLHRGY